MDVAQGAKAWREARDGSYRRSLKSLRRRIRKTESEHGAPRFVFNSRDQGVFDTLMGWKRAQFKTTGKYDVLSAGWDTRFTKPAFGTRPRPNCTASCTHYILATRSPQLILA